MKSGQMSRNVAIILPAFALSIAAIAVAQPTIAAPNSGRDLGSQDITKRKMACTNRWHSRAMTNTATGLVLSAPTRQIMTFGV
ncbi:MAG: hypothetical protein EAZ99_18270 [Alphaproteobacteria bacterium]|nr:MAG: hypothetical protein EAZ99_18270 [Alphaproteobacteria bacterium]